MTTIFQLLNNKVEIFFPSLPLLPLHGAESRSQDTSLAYKNGGGGGGGATKALYFPEVTMVPK